MQLFYKYPAAVGDTVLFDADEAKHIMKVLRIAHGDSIHITDGKGSLFHGILHIEGRKCFATISSSELQPQASPLLHIAIAPTKNRERIEWFVEKAVEMGIGNISFIECENSEKFNVNQDRIMRLAVAAMKQSNRLFLPEISVVLQFQDIVQTVFSGYKFIAHCNTRMPRYSLNKTISRGNDALILIGPEGDFSQEEILLAIEMGFLPVSLGGSRLRTETAALLAVATFHIANE